jgi:hypothetical protein
MGLKKTVPRKLEPDLGVGDDDFSADELAEEFDDTESADRAKAEAEKADPEDKENQP